VAVQQEQPEAVKQAMLNKNAEVDNMKKVLAWQEEGPRRA
jgi:hypothetical protein